MQKASLKEMTEKYGEHFGDIYTGNREEVVRPENYEKDGPYAYKSLGSMLKNGDNEALNQILEKTLVKEEELYKLFFATVSFEKNIVDILKTLAYYGVNINLVNNSGRNALFEAAENGNYLFIEKVLNAKLYDINAKDYDGKNLLMYAISSMNMDNIKLLLENNLDVNETDMNGRTALHYAAAKGSKELIDLLKSYNADFTKEDLWTKIPSEFVPEGAEYEELFEYMEDLRETQEKQKKFKIS